MEYSENIRSFKVKDFLPLVRMLGQEWNLGKRQSQAPGNLCAWLYALDIAAVSTEMFTYKHENKTVGFVSYQAYQKPKKIRQYIYQGLFQMLFKCPTIKKPEKLTEYYNAYDYIPDDMKKEHIGSLEIIIVDKNYRNLKIGAKLFEFIISQTRKMGLQKMLIQTDESCNVRFYEKAGCKKIKEAGVYNEKGSSELNERAFLFEKEI